MIMPGAGPLEITRKVASMVTLEVIQFQRKAIDIVSLGKDFMMGRADFRSTLISRYRKTDPAFDLTWMTGWTSCSKTISVSQYLTQSATD